MLHADRSPEAPTSAAGDSIILHVPSCVQRFSSRRIVSRLRALARRRSRGLPQPEELPLKLLVKENPNWLEEGVRLPGTHQLGALDASGEPVVDRLAVTGDPGAQDREPGMDPALDGSDLCALLSDPEPMAELAPAAGAREAAGDPDAAVMQQLAEDNRDLKAALCRLIRISEQNHAALQLLEDENEELSALVHRLTIGQTRATVAAPPAGSGVPGWRRVPAWGVEWLRRRQARRCT